MIDQQTQDQIYYEKTWYQLLKKNKLKCLIPSTFLSVELTQKIFNVAINKSQKDEDQDEKQEQNQGSTQKIQQRQEKIKLSQQLKRIKAQNLQILKKQINQFLKVYPNGAYLKLGSESAKDLRKGQYNILMLRIHNSDDLFSLIQFSQYLSSLIVKINQKQPHQKQKVTIVLRKYQEELQSQTDQYRVYIRDKIIIGICQKYPHHFGYCNQTTKQTIISHCQTIIKYLNLTNFVIEIYCNLKGKFYILGLQPYFICGLSLFTENQLENELKKHVTSKEHKVFIKMVENQSQLKEEDFTQFSVQKEFQDPKNIKQWMQFMNQNK